jgi:WD40 repeat protein
MYFASISKGSKSIICSLLQVSTHGHPKNRIYVWAYPSLTQVADLASYAGGVIYLAVSPYGDRIATGSADKTLCFWDIFSRTEARSLKVSTQFSGKKYFLMDHIFKDVL